MKILSRGLLAISSLSAISIAALATGGAGAQDNGINVDSPPIMEATEIAPMDSAEALALDSKYYAEAYGVSEDEAMRRLLIMHGTKEEIEAIEAEYGDRLSGIYFDNSADFGLKVRLTGDNVPTDKKLLRKARKDNRKAERQAARRIASIDAKKTARQSRKSKFEVSEADITRAENMIEQDAETKIVFKGQAKATKKAKNQVLRQNAAKLAKNGAGSTRCLF